MWINENWETGKSCQTVGYYLERKSFSIITEHDMNLKRPILPNNQAIIIHDSITEEMTKSLHVPSRRKQKGKTCTCEQIDDNEAQTGLCLLWDCFSFCHQSLQRYGLSATFPDSDWVQIKSIFSINKIKEKEKKRPASICSGSPKKIISRSQDLELGFF